jgi:hypothetical protein
LVATSLELAIVVLPDIAPSGRTPGKAVRRPYSAWRLCFERRKVAARRTLNEMLCGADSDRPKTCRFVLRQRASLSAEIWPRVRRLRSGHRRSHDRLAMADRLDCDAADLVRLKRCAPQQICHQQSRWRPGQHHPEYHSLDHRHRTSPRLIHERDSQSVNSALNRAVHKRKMLCGATSGRGLSPKVNPLSFAGSD